MPLFSSIQVIAILGKMYTTDMDCPHILSKVKEIETTRTLNAQWSGQLLQILAQGDIELIRFVQYLEQEAFLDAEKLPTVDERYPEKKMYNKNTAMTFLGFENESRRRFLRKQSLQ
jgi:hypothetical protein